MSLLELENVTAHYGRARVLHGVDVDVPDGGATGILGANGAGKTTTLRAISGLVRTGGRITFDGRDITKSSPDTLARMGVAHVPEGRGTLTGLSVRDNLAVGAYRRRNRHEIADDLDYCYDLFPILKAREKASAATLSGGEQQMLAIARAFMAKPRLLLLDEASLGLAPSTAEQVYASIARLRAETGLSMLLVEQNAMLALDVAERATVLETGRSVLSGTADELLGMDSVRKAYLGG